MKTEPTNNSTDGEIVFVNPHIWKASKVSRLEFLRRIRCVEALRVYAVTDASQQTTEMPVISFFPGSLSAWGLLEKFHRVVNEADFSVFDGYDRILAIMAAPKPVQWIRNTKLVTLQRQILNWIAAWSTYHYGKFPDENTTVLPPGVREEVEAIKREFYDDSRFTNDNLWETHYPERLDQLIRHYEETSKNLTGAPPPEILKLPRFKLNVALEAWGLGQNFNLPYRYACFLDRDWERIVVQGTTDDLDRMESSEELWEKWLYTFDNYPATHNHVFRVLGNEVQMGFVYLLQGEELGRYKIGFTASGNSYSRRGSLQTGSAERLVPAGHFRAASAKTEQTVKMHFEAKRVRPDGEWYALAKQDVDNLLDEDWRIRNNIF